MPATSPALAEGVVLRIEGTDAVIVQRDGAELLCDVLDRGGIPLLLAPDDRVLLWIPDPTAPRAVIMGRLGLSHAPIPDTLLLEAAHSLTLRVGDGSITIRDDGKILIKGQDLVSHATRMNRIKGGAVSIN